MKKLFSLLVLLVSLTLCQAEEKDLVAPAHWVRGYDPVLDQNYIDFYFEVEKDWRVEMQFSWDLEVWYTFSMVLNYQREPALKHVVVRASDPRFHMFFRAIVSKGP